MYKDRILEAMLKAVREINYEEIINEGKEIIGRNPSGDETLRFDKNIENRIVSSLRNNGFKGVIRGEEKESYGGNIEEGIIIIDPIDGSLNALRGLPLYATLIAYAEKDSINSVSRAIVHAPALRRTYMAIKNKGAYVLINNEVKRLELPPKALLKPIIEVVSTYTFKYTRRLVKYGKIRRFGSIGLAIVFVAEGAIDAVIDIGKRARVPDVIAPFLILSEAGGKIIVNEKNSLSPRGRLNFIAGRPDLVEQLRKELWRFRKE